IAGCKCYALLFSGQLDVNGRTEGREFWSRHKNPAARGQDAGHEPLEGPRRAHPRADGGPLPPPPRRRRGPRRGATAGPTGAESQVPRAVLLGRLLLPGRSVAVEQG